MEISNLESPVIVKVQVDEDGLVNHTVSSFNKDLDLETMQTVIGRGNSNSSNGWFNCYIDILKSACGKFDIVTDADGKLRSLPINKLATDLYDRPDDYIVGDVIIAPVGLID